MEEHRAYVSEVVQQMRSEIASLQRAEALLADLSKSAPPTAWDAVGLATAYLQGCEDAAVASAIVAQARALRLRTLRTRFVHLASTIGPQPASGAAHRPSLDVDTAVAPSTGQTADSDKDDGGSSQASSDTFV